MNQKIELSPVSTLSGNGTTSPVVTIPYMNDPGVITVWVYGTFAATPGTLKVQASPDGTNWFDVGSTLSAVGVIKLVDVAPRFLRFNLAGATGTTALSIVVTY